MINNYPEYKKSNFDWIGNIPSNWEILKLKNICTFGKGKDLSKSTLNKNGKYECILYGELYTIYKNQNRLNHIISSTNKITNVISNGQEILIPGSTTTTGKDLCNSKFLNKSGVLLGGDIIILYPKDENYLNDYLSYFITYVCIPEFIQRSKGVTIDHIYSKDIREMTVCLPTITEQKKIVSFLDFKKNIIDKIIDKIEKKIKILVEKRYSIIDYFIIKGINKNTKSKESGINWIGKMSSDSELIKLKFLVSKVGTGLTPKGGSQVYLEEGIPFLRSQNIHFEGLQLDNVVYISNEIHNKMSNSKVLPNDVLFNVTGNSIGRCYFTEHDSVEYNVNQHVCIIRPNEKIDTKYLYYCLYSKIGQNQVVINNTGSGKEGLSSQNIKNFILPYYKLEEQVRIVEFIDEKIKHIDNLINKETKRIKLLKEYRQSLMSEVLTGKVDIRGLN